MKTLVPSVPVVEVPNEGLVSFLGKPVTLFCMNYIYSGILEGVNDTFVKLKGAQIVYETGSFTTAGWKDAQSLPGSTWFVQQTAIESFGGVK